MRLRPSLRETTIGVALGLTCSITWGIANVYVQRAARQVGDLPALFWSQLIGALVLLPAGLWWSGVPAEVEWVTLGITAFASIFGYYGMIRAFHQGPLAAVTPIITSWPLVTGLAGFVWLDERVTTLQVIGGCLVIAGAAGNGALAQGGEWHGSRRDAFRWAIASALGFGVMTAGVARLRPGLGELTVVPVVWFSQWVLLLPWVVQRRMPMPRPTRWAAVFGMAAFEAAGFVAYSTATRFAPVAVVSPPASLSTLLTAAFAAAFLAERIGVLRWALIALAAAGTILIAR